MDPSRSFLLTVELGLLPEEWGEQQVPEVLGWEANAAGKLGPR